MVSIIITAIITFIITVLAGVLVEYIKNMAPKVTYNVRDGIPIAIDNKKICAYIITVTNPSSKTIKDITVSVESSLSKLKSAGASITKALKYNLLEKENSVEVSIPFLSKGDEISITLYVEDQYVNPSKPDIIIRSPERFKTVNSTSAKKKNKSFLFELTPGIVAAVMVGAALNFFNFGINQKDNLMFLSSACDLPELTIMYSMQNNVNYYDQGSLVYAKAKMSKNIEEIKRYREFLIALQNYTDIGKMSKGVINYNIGKISLLLNDEQQAKMFFSNSIKESKNTIENIIKYDKEVEKFMLENGVSK